MTDEIVTGNAVPVVEPVRGCTSLVEKSFFMSFSADVAEAMCPQGRFNLASQD
jgi:hypothetical protein